MAPDEGSVEEAEAGGRHQPQPQEAIGTRPLACASGKIRVQGTVISLARLVCMKHAGQPCKQHAMVKGLQLREQLNGP